MFLIIFLYQEFEDNLDTHTHFIQELENRPEDCGLELIEVVKSEECGICATRDNSTSFSLKLSGIDIWYVMNLIICECYDYINCLYD